MRRIDYRLTGDGEPFTVASYCVDGRNAAAAMRSCRHIEMSIIRCVDNSGKDINILRVAQLNTHGLVGFSQRYADVLMGETTEWNLVQFQIDAGCVSLQYCCPTTGDVEDIRIDIHNSPVATLNLEFKVPHEVQDNRPDTEYHVFMDYHFDKPSYYLTTVKEHLSPHGYNVFQFSSREPNEISVTEYVDL